METLHQVTSAPQPVPKKNKRARAEVERPVFEYNAGLDTFQPSSPPGHFELGKSLVRRFGYGLADWIDPAGAKPRG